MNIKAFLVLLSLFQYGVAWSQSSIVDSLQYQLSQTNDSQTKVETWNELVWQLRMEKTNQALMYANRALNVSKANGFKQHVGTAHSRLGSCFFEIGDYDSASFHHSKAFEIRSSNRDYQLAANSALNLGICLNRAGRNPNSLNALNRAEHLYDSLNIPSERLFVQIQVINTFSEMGRFADALQLLDSCESISEDEYSENLDLIGELRMARTRLHQLTYEHSLALKSSNEAVSIYSQLNRKMDLARALFAKGNIHYLLGQRDSCLVVYQRTLSILATASNRALLFKVNSGLMQFWLSENQLDSSAHYLDVADSISGQLAESTQHSLFYKQKGDFYSAIRKYDQAAMAYEKSIQLHPHSPPIQLLETYYNTHLAYRNLGLKNKAIDALNKRDILRDSLEKARIEARSLERQLQETRHQSELFKKESAKQKAESELKKTQLNLSLIITSITVVLLLVFIGYQRERNKRKQTRNSQALLDEKVDGLLQKQELKSIVNVLEIQERERRRIARDLHDRLGGMLATMKLLFHDVESSFGEFQEKSKITYNKALGILDNAGEEVRKVAHNLVSGALKNFGLEAALKELADTIQQSESVNFQFISHGLTDRLTTTYESHLYRIVQEMISNTLKHAKATEITLQILRDSERLNLVYEDNGMGFKPEDAEEGMGLKSIASRAEKLNGKFEIDSGKGAGTTYNITIPINSES